MWTLALVLLAVAAVWIATIVFVVVPFCKIVTWADTHVTLDDIECEAAEGQQRLEQWMADREIAQ